MGRFEKPNMGFPHIRKSVSCELLLLGYIILEMAQITKWYHERIKAAIEARKNNEMGSCKAARVSNVTQPTLECYVKDRQKRQSETVKIKLDKKQVL